MPLFDGDKSERIGEGEMGFRIGVEDGDTEPVLPVGRQDHRKLIVEEAPSRGAAQAAAIHERGDPHAMRCQRLVERRRAFPAASTTRTRSPWTAAIADSVRICRSRLPGLNGKSSRAGLARSTILRRDCRAA